jgi:hypothetical protein
MREIGTNQASKMKLLCMQEDRRGVIWQEKFDSVIIKQHKAEK